MIAVDISHAIGVTELFREGVKRYLVRLGKGLKVITREEESKHIVHAISDEDERRLIGPYGIEILEKYCSIKTPEELIKKSKRWGNFDEETRKGLFQIATAEPDSKIQGLLVSEYFDRVHTYIRENTDECGPRESALFELDLAMRAHEEGNPRIYFN